MPDTDLLTGGVQSVLAWVILAQMALYVITVRYFIGRQNKQETKHDELQLKFQKLLVRSNRAIEAVADLPPPAVEDDLND